MERPTCKTCPYWKQLSEAELYGECRRDPAKRGREIELGCDPGTVNITWGLWFDQHEDEWCGAHPEFSAYIASLKPPDTPRGALDKQDQAELERIARSNPIRSVSFATDRSQPPESTGNSVLDKLIKTVEKY